MDKFVATTTGDQPKVTFFKVQQRDTRGQVFRKSIMGQDVMVGIAITGGILINGNTSYQN